MLRTFSQPYSLVLTERSLINSLDRQKKSSNDKGSVQKSSNEKKDPKDYKNKLLRKEGWCVKCFESSGKKVKWSKEHASTHVAASTD